MFHTSACLVVVSLGLAAIAQGPKPAVQSSTAMAERPRLVARSPKPVAEGQRPKAQGPKPEADAAQVIAVQQFPVAQGLPVPRRDSPPRLGTARIRGRVVAADTGEP